MFYFPHRTKLTETISGIAKPDVRIEGILKPQDTLPLFNDGNPRAVVVNKSTSTSLQNRLGISDESFEHHLLSSRGSVDSDEDSHRGPSPWTPFPDRKNAISASRRTMIGRGGNEKHRRMYTLSLILEVGNEIMGRPHPHDKSRARSRPLIDIDTKVGLHQRC